MHFRKRWWKVTQKAAPILFALAPISGCAQHEMEVHPEAFNRAVGALDMRLLLLNTVRASKDYPIQFTKVTNALAGAKISGDVDPTIPIPFFAARSYDPGVKVSGQRDFSNMNIANLNTKEALEGLKREITLPELISYQRSGWPSGIVYTLGIQDIRVSYELQSALDEKTKQKCYTWTELQEREELACRVIRRWDQECYVGSVLDYVRGDPYTFRGREIRYFKNDPKNKCAFGTFQTLLEQFTLARFNFDVETTTSRVEKVDTGKILMVKETGRKPIFETGDATIDDLVNRPDALAFAKRSVDRIVRYLGEIVAVQNYTENAFVPKTVVDGDEVNLFVVKNGRNDIGLVSVSVEGPEREWFFVPTPDYGSAKRDRTLQVMAFVIDLLNSAVSKTSIPLIQPVTITSP